MYSYLLSRAATLNDSATRYFNASAAVRVANSFDNNVLQVVPNAMTLDRLFIYADTAPGGGKSIAFTLQKNGSDTALTCTLSGTDLSTSDVANSVSFAAGDTISIKAVPSGTPTLSSTYYSSIRQSASGLYGLLGAGGNPSGSSTTYSSLMTSIAWRTTEAEASAPVPTSGVIKNMYIKLNGAPASGKSLAFTLMVNGSPTALTATVSNTATTANDTANSVSIAAGDLVSIQSVPSGTPSSSIQSYIAVSFEPDTDGEFFLQSGYFYTSAPSTSATQYNSVLNGGGGNAWLNTQTSRVHYMGASIAKAAYFTLSANPGTAKSYAFTLQSQGANTAITTTISGANTSGSITGQSVNLADQNTISMKSVPSGTPTSAFVKFGVLFSELPLIEALTDDFDDNSLDTAKWDDWGGAQTVETTNKLVVTVPNATSNYYGISTFALGSLIGSSAMVELVSVSDASPDELEVEFQLVADDDNRIWFMVGNNTIQAYQEVAGSATSLASATYNSTNHRWLRMREASGTTCWETSTNGNSWSAFHSIANPIQLVSLYAVLDAGAWDTSHGQVIATFDNFNVIPGGGDIELDVDDLSSSAALSTVTLEEQAALSSVAALTSSSALSTITLEQANTLANVSELTSQPALSTVVLEESVELTGVASLTSAASMTTADLVQANTIAMADLGLSPALSAVSLEQQNTLDGVSELISAPSLSTVELSQANVLAMDDLQSQPSMSTAALTQANTVAVDGMTSQTTLEEVVLSFAALISPDDMTAAAVLEALDLTQQNSLSLAGLAQQPSLSTIALTQQHALLVASLLVEPELSANELIQAYGLLVADLVSHAVLAEVLLTSDSSRPMSPLGPGTTISASRRSTSLGSRERYSVIGSNPR